MRRLPTQTILILTLFSPLSLAMQEASAPDPFARAPLGVVLDVTEGTRLLAAGEEYAETLFTRLAADFPGRFTHNEDEGTWADSLGEYAWDEEEEMYWQNVSAETLTQGRREFVQFCSSCHGFSGDGYGRSARALRPPPRDFTRGLFKFTKVPSEFLPSDDALVALVQRGLDGTPMLPWDVPESRLRPLVQYIKSLSPEDEGWRDPINDIGDPIEAGDDPWAGRRAEAVASGERLYHRNGCYNCHPAYVPPSKINEFRGRPAGTAYRDNLTQPKLLAETSYEVLGKAVPLLPPDFTWHTIRSGRTVEDVARTLKVGIPGAGMPDWQAVANEDIWAIAHYIRHLIETFKDRPATRAGLMAPLRG